MKIIKKIMASTSLLALLSSVAYADPAAPGNDQVEQLKVLLQQVQTEMNATSQSYVFLGSNQQIGRQGSNENITNLMSMLIAALNDYHSSTPKNLVPGLKWLSAAADKLPTEPLLDAGVPGELVNVCRAPFLGVYAQNGAIYPGQLTASGCRISYAGYAFIMTEFTVLAGSGAGMQWIPITIVNASVKSQQKANTSKQPVMPGGRQPMVMPVPVPPMDPAYATIKINGASALSGGYDQGGVVLLCRAKQNSRLSVGKLVLYTDANGERTGACDIGVDNKEVTVKSDFDLLFWK